MREFLKFQELATGAMAGIRGLPVPVIAAINGAAAGGGMALALSADIRLASPNAKINAAFVKIGLSVGELGTSWTLQRLVGTRPRGRDRVHGPPGARRRGRADRALQPRSCRPSR